MDPASWGGVVATFVAPRGPAGGGVACKSSRWGPGEQASIRSYCSSGLRECSRLRVSIMLTWERAGARGAHAATNTE